MTRKPAASNQYDRRPGLELDVWAYGGCWTESGTASFATAGRPFGIVWTRTEKAPFLALRLELSGGKGAVPRHFRWLRFLSVVQWSR